MKYRIRGDLAQIAEIALDQGETCWSSRGSIMSMTEQASWDLRVPGGLGGAVRRTMAGEGAALNFVSSEADGQMVRLSSNSPGKIIDWDLSQGAVVATRGSFVAAFGPAVDIDIMVARRAGAALFGGAGLFLQRISGEGVVLIHGSGDFVDQELAAGQSVLVSTGNLAAFSDQVDYNIQGIGGCRRIFFGGEGLFMTKLTGPGRILLQTLKRSAGSTTSSTSGGA